MGSGFGADWRPPPRVELLIEQMESLLCARGDVERRPGCCNACLRACGYGSDDGVGRVSRSMLELHRTRSFGGSLSASASTDKNEENERKRKKRRANIAWVA